MLLISFSSATTRPSSHVLIHRHRTSIFVSPVHCSIALFRLVHPSSVLHSHSRIDNEGERIISPSLVVHDISRCCLAREKFMHRRSTHVPLFFIMVDILILIKQTIYMMTAKLAFLLDIRLRGSVQCFDALITLTLHENESRCCHCFAALLSASLSFVDA